MKLHYNATGPDRKELVAVISKTIGMKPVYKGMPTCTYAVNNILIEKDGTVVYDERTDQDTIEAIIVALAAAGFQAETGTDKEEGSTGVAIQMIKSHINNRYHIEFTPSPANSNSYTLYSISV